MLTGLKNQYRWMRDYIKIAKKALRCKENTLFLLNTPLHGNLGDHAIVLAEEKLIKEHCKGRDIIEIPGALLARHMKLYRRIIKKQDILITGGGYLGTLWMFEENIVRKVISTFPKNKIIILPQTIYFEDSAIGRSEKEKSKKIYNAHNNLTICTREKLSYKIAKELFVNAKILLIPDMVAYLDCTITSNKRNGISFCLRNDKEMTLSKEEQHTVMDIVREKYPKQPVSYIDTVCSYNISTYQRKNEVTKLLEQIAENRLIITDRLHGMLFCAITSTPCIVFSNCNQKISGVYEFIKHNKYVIFVKNIQEMKEALEYIEGLKNLPCYDNAELKKAYNPLIRLLGGEE